MTDRPPADTLVAPLADVLAETDAAYDKMTPGPWTDAGQWKPRHDYCAALESPDGGVLHHEASWEFRDEDRAGIVALVNHWPRIRAELARKDAALRDISAKLECDFPCEMRAEAGACGACGHIDYGHWCAGCVARAALGAPNGD